MEVWKPIPGFEGAYEASTHGRIKSLARHISCVRKCAAYTFSVRERILKFGTTPEGYYTVSLGKGHTAFVHRVVTRTFHGAPPKKTMFACHRNDDKKTNTVDNLYWGTHRQNIDDAMRNNKCPRGEAHGGTSLSKDDVIKIRSLRNKREQRDIAKMFGIAQSTVGRIQRREVWRHI